MTGARVILIPPPLYYVAGLAGGLAAHAVTPWSIGGRPATTVVGGAVLAAGSAMMAGGVVGVIRHRTTIVPHHPVSTLVTSGAYRISRNHPEEHYLQDRFGSAYATYRARVRRWV